MENLGTEPRLWLVEALVAATGKERKDRLWRYVVLATGEQQAVDKARAELPETWAAAWTCEPWAGDVVSQGLRYKARKGVR